jgi:hypothetical protein
VGHTVDLPTQSCQLLGQGSDVALHHDQDLILLEFNPLGGSNLREVSRFVSTSGAEEASQLRLEMGRAESLRGRSSRRRDLSQRLRWSRRRADALLRVCMEGANE